MTDFPFTTATPPTFPEAPPEAADVVVIGGGIIGVMSASFLAERGLKVVLCEKGRIAAEQSSRNWGWVRQQGRDPAELPIMMEANRLWRELADECGETLGFRQSGVLYLAGDDSELERFERWQRLAHEHGLDTRLLSRSELADHLPGARGDWPGALLTPSDGRAEPWQAVPALARAAARRGASLHEHCAVRTLETSGGRIEAVVTEGGRIRCDRVVLAGGAWSGLFARNLGVNLPQLSVLGSVARTRPLASRYAGAAADPAFAFRRRQDGAYTLAPGMAHDFFIGPDAFRHCLKYLPQLRSDFRSTRFRPRAPAGYPDAWGTPRRWSGDDVSPFERTRILDPEPDRKALSRALARFNAAFPGEAAASIERAWGGMIDTLPDTRPILDRAPDLSGLIIATGMSGHGFGIGPAIGRIVADLVAGRPPGHDLSAFRFERFSDGSPIVPSPAF